MTARAEAPRCVGTSKEITDLPPLTPVGSLHHVSSVWSGIFRSLNRLLPGTVLFPVRLILPRGPELIWW